MRSPLGRTVALLLTLALSPALAVAAPAGRVTHRALWRLDFFDDFRKGLRPNVWGAYSGEPGGDPGGWWSPSHVVVARGLLDLETYPDPQFGWRWVSGGVSSGPSLKQTYGKYQVRIRVDGGKGVAFAALLWPANNKWPPEIDFAESGGGTGARNQISAFFHHGAKDDQIGRTLRVDFTKWHVVGVEWLPGELIYTIDGRAWSVIKSRAVPAEPMEMDIQTQAGTCGNRWQPCPGNQTPTYVNAQIQWVKVYAYLGPR